MCDEIVQKLLRKDRNERYQGRQELLNDLYRHGASSGPTRLRLQVDPDLQATIDRPITPTSLTAMENPVGTAPTTSVGPAALPRTGRHAQPSQV